MSVRTTHNLYDIEVVPIDELPSGETWAATVTQITENLGGNHPRFSATEYWGHSPGEALNRAFEAAAQEIGDTNPG